MDLILPLDHVRPEDLAEVGGKCLALSRMLKSGFRVPGTLCVSARAYEAYVERNGLRERILLELHRKDFQDMRWEELWDASLRIRNMFLTSPMPAKLAQELGEEIGRFFGSRPVVVRSSAPAEDSAGASFAGLHESYVNVRGIDSILDHVRKVWASLWSDAALLYRRELGLEVATSTMAVAIQEIVVGTCSGVAFGVNPNDSSQAVIESVHGLNQGLVDGAVEPDRWIVDRETEEVLEHTPAARERRMVPSPEGLSMESLPPELSEKAPLDSAQVSTVFRLTRDLEQLFEGPQDVEWTFREGQVFILQSRPVTAGTGSRKGDQRSWYLSLRKSYENLKAMRMKIEAHPGDDRGGRDPPEAEPREPCGHRTGCRDRPKETDRREMAGYLLDRVHSVRPRNAALRTGVQRPCSAFRPLRILGPAVGFGHGQCGA
jgi:phosphoenolpyruvate synthase/pyruvate phosphate dikinase